MYIGMCGYVRVCMCVCVLRVRRYVYACCGGVVSNKSALRSSIKDYAVELRF